MNLKKLAPWNWFKHENEHDSNLPIKRNDYQYDNPVAKLHKEIDKIFSDAFNNFSFPGFDNGGLTSAFNNTGLLRPKMDISTDKNNYKITVEVPGVDEKDVKLELIDDRLILKGEKKQESETKDNDFYRIERSYGSFERTLSLPDDADKNDIKASFKNGVVTITMPKVKSEQESVKLIDIEKG